ncbi:hypothetical protein [Streptomyces cinnamoneus]|uniref:Uncharacterized protein n=1 Tax=Streptomyces cinnamoneus TaxID=53446 RepID=A0A918T964_STRCJ|nr:hypothetical protein [Streptomyces cinnamoneus]GHC34507.1 hypothetical protein GCM10010507_04120 [Streptomyces cinnamoneus]
MDLDSATEELFRLRPEEFTAARDRIAAEAGRAGDRELAGRVKALRKPTLAAWVSNLLVRERPDEAGALTALGQGLREAHRKLDGGALRELSRRQRTVVASLSREAGRLAAEAGHPVGGEVQREVEETLHAVLADARAAQEWAAGRLSRPLTAVTGFPGLAPDAAEQLAAPPAPAGPASGAGRGAHVTDLAEARERRRRSEERRERLERVREEERARQEEWSRLREEADRADEAERAAHQRVEELTLDLGAAQDRLGAAQEASHRLQDRLRAADHAWRAARRTAEAVESEPDPDG